MVCPSSSSAQAIAGAKSQPRRLEGLAISQSSDLGTTVTHRAETLGTIFREGSVLQVEKEPMTDIQDILYSRVSFLRVLKSIQVS